MKSFYNVDYALEWERKGNTMTIAKVTVDQIIDAVERDDLIGFCLSCGLEAYGVEPDAHKYECESCGERAVFGAEELLIMM